MLEIRRIGMRTAQLNLRQESKSQRGTVTRDWSARYSAERMIEIDIYLSWKHNFEALPSFSQLIRRAKMSTDGSVGHES
jgi:hypothetical protein